MMRRTALLALAAFALSASTGCYHFRNFVAKIRCCGCGPVFHNPGYGSYGATYPAYDSGCATCYSGPQQPVVYGQPQPIMQGEHIGYPRPMGGGVPKVEENRNPMTPMNPMGKN
jgi:hypothetical protein